MHLKRKRSNSSQYGVSPSKRLKATWNDSNTKVLLEVMIEEIHTSKRGNCQFNSDGWRNIVQKFELRTGLSYTILQLKNRSSHIRKLYGKWRKLNNQASDLCLDPTTGAIQATDSWWAKMAREDPKILKWKESPPKLIQLMAECYASNFATGKDMYGPSYCRGGGTFPAPPQSVPPMLGNGTVSPCSGDIGESASNTCAPVTSPPSCANYLQNKHNRGGTPKQPAGDKQCSPVGNIVGLMKTKDESLKLDDCREMDTAMQLLNQIEGLKRHGQVYVACIRVLDDKLKRYTFINHISDLPQEVQLEWFKGWII